MARFEDQTASFMMLCLGDFSSKLCIPTKFMTKYRQVVQQSMMLETDYSRQRWSVKIENMNSDFYMNDGWPVFVKDNQLGDLDFLTFRLVGKSTFNVSIYASDGCPKLIPTSPTSTAGDGDFKVETEGRDENERGIKRGRGDHGANDEGTSRRINCFFKEDNPLYFEIRLKSHHKSRISLPRGFTKAANMKGRKQVRMEHAANQHPISVTLDHRQHNRIDLTQGWPEFRVANQLVYGNIYSFEFSPDHDVIHVNEVNTREVDSD